ncbi:MAG TPA: ABC transporter permease [Vicinamibacterales bacterium]|nr:ABC transporter permease [Vicinamibacterales bacterium]
MTSSSTSSAATSRSVGELALHVRPFAETFGTLVVAALLLVAFSLTSNVFLQPTNLRNILVQITVVAVAAIGETIVMLMGGLDLSVGANVLLGSVVAADLAQHQSLPLSVAIAGGIAASTAIGFLNGVLTAVIGIEPILATLGTFLLAGGLAKITLHSSWIVVGSHFFADLARTRLLWQLPLMVIVMLALYAATAVLMRVTPFGRSIYAIGGNAAAARIAGLPAIRIRVAAFTLAGAFAGIAGLLQIGQLGIVSSGNATGLEFQAITAALIGGLSISAGGVGRVERTLLGAVIVGMISNYQTIRGVAPNYQQALLGGILLLSIVVDRLFRGRQL